MTPAIASACVVFAALLVTLGGVVWRLAVGLTAAKNKADAAMIVANDATTLARQAERDLSTFREQVARTYVTSEGLTRLETALTGAINRLGDRLDRVLEGHNGKGSA